MSQRFAVVYEASADFRMATELADREFIDAIDWLDEHQIANQREWIEAETAGRPLTWANIKQLASEARIKAHGHFAGQPGEADAAAARRAILYLKATFPDLNAIILVRDQDDQPERRLGLEQARGQHHDGTVIVIGLAIVEREAWVITGFDPQTEAESALLDVERQTLGLDPRHRSQDLTACKDERARRSPKRVLQSLSGGDWERERHCWISAPLDTLRTRGKDNGLLAYLDEVRTRMAPLIGHVSGAQ